ncbi:RNA-directed DNA polymerase, eukaryota, reverse transcriptase zinc-binding domain protein [Tanacetum coccineum]
MVSSKLAEKRFKYHWGCKELKITSLCFADDLLMLCHGDLISASVLRRGLDEFCVSSGLRPSMSKVRLSFEMSLMRLTSKDCKPLIEMIRKRIGDWRNKVLSFAGRLQLISSVLSSMQVYWASLFILPIGEIRFYLLLSNGLGLRYVTLERSAMAKHIWNIVSRKNSIWVKWVNIYCLKGRCMWDDELSRGYSWSWKQLFDLKNKIKKFVQVKIGNVSNMIDGNEWSWPIEWDVRFDVVTKIHVPRLDANVKDKMVWVDKNGKEKAFSVKEVWRAIRDDCPKVIWYKHVWYSQCIPRHAFILWVAVKGRLKTLDRISKWMEIQSMACYLCNEYVESHNHLFFSCPYSKRLWERLKPMARLEGISNCWPSIISAIVNKSSNNTIWSVIQRLVWGACVYFIWQERNGRCFMKMFRDIDCLFNMIMDSVRLRLLGLTIKTTPSVLEALKFWNLQINKVDFHKRMDEALGNGFDPMEF